MSWRSRTSFAPHPGRSNERARPEAAAATDCSEYAARQKAIVEASLDAVITLDADGRILDLNITAENILGHSRSQVLGRLWLEVVFPGRGADFPAWEGRRFPLGERLEVIAQRADGTSFPAEITTSAVPLPARTLYAVWLRDISERRNLENQLWRSQKMEAVGRLAGGVAHDFNNILTVITGYSDLVLTRLAAGDPRRKNVEEIKRAGERAATLTRQLLAFSRRQVQALQALDLNAVVLNVDQMLRRLIGEDIEVSNVLAADLGTVSADPGQMEQVLLNLAVNARDAMPQGGKLTIETCNSTVDALQSRRHSPPMPPGQYVQLVVSDTGCGMDQKTQSLIFEPFFTTKEEGKGTGLGLSTVYGIVKQSGGFIWVYSEPGCGATFRIYLPCSSGPARPAEEQPAPAAPGFRGTETLLLVEDEDQVRTFVREVLEGAGYIVLDAARGEEAMRRFSAHPDSIDLVLTDVVMPQMGGRELARTLQTIDPGIKVVYMSGYAENAVVHHGVLDPGSVLIQKPFTSGGLLRKVRAALDSPKTAGITPFVTT